MARELTFNEQLLREIGLIRESGVTDSSILNIEDAIFCGIPGYVSSVPEDRVFPTGGEFRDPSYIESHVEEIIDKILTEPLPDISSSTGWIPRPNTDVPGSVAADVNTGSSEVSTPGDGFAGPGDASAGEQEIGDVSIIEAGERGSCHSAIIEFAAKTEEYPELPYEIFVHPGDNIDEETIIGRCWQHGEWRDIRSIFSSGTVRQDPEDGGFGRLYKTVCSRHIIIDCYELANLKSYDGVDMKILCEKPKLFDIMQKRLEKSQVAMGLIMFLFPYLMYLRLCAAFAGLRPVVVSFLTLPIVNSDLFYSIAGGQITGENTKTYDRNDTNGVSQASIYQYQSENVVDNFTEEATIDLGEVRDGWEVIIPSESNSDFGSFGASKKQPSKELKAYSILEDNGERRIFVSGSRKHIEDEFTRYITEVYEPRRKKFLDEVKEAYGEDGKNLKATMGNPIKMKEIGDKILEARNSYFNDVIMMMKHPEFRVPLYEEDPEYYWYTSVMHKKFGFKILKTFLNSDIASREEYKEYFNHPHDQEDDELLEELVSRELNETEPTPEDGDEESDLGNLLSKTNREDIDPITEDGMNFRELFKNLSMSLPYGGLTDLEAELKKMLVRYSETHKEEGDAREDINREISELTEFFIKCLDFAGGLPGEEVEVPLRIDSTDKDNDPFLIELLKAVPAEAEWPYEPTDYEYRGFKYQKYTFPNIDAMMSSEDDRSSDAWLENNNDYKKEDNAGEYLSSDDLKVNVEELVVPEADSVTADPGDVEGMYNDRALEDENPDIIELDDMRYWWRYLGIATIVTIPFLATGIITTPVPYVMLPCIYIPLKVISISKCGLVLVIGLAIRGLSINLLLIPVNMNQQANSLMFPVTLSLTEIRDQAILNINGMLDIVPMIANSLMSVTKADTVSLLKENKKYDAQMAGLKAIQLPGKNTIIRDVKEELGQDTRMIVNRLESDIQGSVDKTKSLVIDTSDQVASTATGEYKGMADELSKIKSNKSSEEKKEE